jgi:hypothetical protein
VAPVNHRPRGADAKRVTFTEQDVPNMAHVWPLWRQNLTDVAQRLFQPRR